MSINGCTDARVRLQRAWNGAVDNLIQLKGTGVSINLSSNMIWFSCCHQFNNFAMEFTISLLCVLDILLSSSISSLDLHLRSLPLIGTELNYSATPPPSLVTGGVGRRLERWGLPGRAAAPAPDASCTPPPWHTQPESQAAGVQLGYCCSLALGQAACTCIKKTKTRVDIALKITNFTSVSTQLQIFLWEADKRKLDSIHICSC